MFDVISKIDSRLIKYLMVKVKLKLLINSESNLDLTG